MALDRLIDFTLQIYFTQVPMGVTKPQAHLLVLPNATSGTDRVSHSVLSFSRMAATDLLLDLPLQ